MWVEGIDPQLIPVGVTNPPEPLARAARARPQRWGSSTTRTRKTHDPLKVHIAASSKEHGPWIVRLPGRLEEMVAGWPHGRLPAAQRASACFTQLAVKNGSIRNSGSILGTGTRNAETLKRLLIGPRHGPVQSSS